MKQLISLDSFILKLRMFLVKHPRLRSLIRRLRQKIKRIPHLGNIFQLLEKSLILTYAEERYNLKSPFSDRVYFESYAGFIEQETFGRVLDLGCGYGYLTERLANKDGVSEVVGIDKIKDFHCYHPKIKYISADITKLKNFPGKFDVIVSTEFIEHISKNWFEKLIPIIRSSMAPEGIFIGSTPDLALPSGSPFHIKEYNHNELKELFDKYFTDVEIKSIGFDCMIFKIKKIR